MAAPVDAGRATTDGSTSTTSHTLNLPASIAAGDIIFVHCRSPIATSYSISGFTELRDASPDGADDTLYIAWKIADGTEGTSISVTLGTAARMSGIAWRITGNLMYVADVTGGTGTNSQPDAPSVTLSPADAHDILWITLASGDTTRTLTNPPSGYSNGTISAHTGGDGGAGSCFVAGATLQSTADTTENAGAWTLDGNPSNWSAFTFPVMESPARVTQQAAEFAAQADNSEARVTQQAAEFAAQADNSEARVTQQAFEVAVSTEPPLRLTQEPVEVVASPDNQQVRMTQEPVEVVASPDNQQVRMTQLPVEVVRERILVIAPTFQVLIID